MTTKLYYSDAYIKEFEAEVVSTVESKNGYITVLDRTAFFPEEGGQSSDKGCIGEARVIDVYEKDGVVYHITDREVPIGKVQCKLDFEERFEKMQLHTAEHIICGVIHKLYGYDNVGFHLGEDIVTFDINGVLSRDELNNVETLTNEAVFSNIKVECYFPKREDLEKIEYRSKLELTENVRLVKIGEVDVCACCAPHVSYTGEIGIVKILDFMKHRGGLRITMQAGRRALVDYRTKYENLLKISAMLSTPQHESAKELERYMKDVDMLRSELKASKIKEAQRYAESIPQFYGNKVFLMEDYTSEQLRAFGNIVKDKTDGLVICLSGKDNDFKYLIAAKDKELSLMVKEINKDLFGRGGGRGEMVTGTFACTLSAIENYFK